MNSRQNDKCNMTNGLWVIRFIFMKKAEDQSSADSSTPGKQPSSRQKGDEQTSFRCNYM